MDKIILAIGAAVFVGIVVFLAAIMNTCFGALGGWLVGWLFDETTFRVLTFSGLESFAMWEVGATLGFFGSFFKSSSSSSTN